MARLLGAMPADAPGLERLWFGGRDLNRGSSRAGHAVPAGTLSGMAVLPHAAVEHGHGAGQEFDCDRFALCRTGAGRRIARENFRAYPSRMAFGDRNAARHHGPGTIAAG